MRKTRDTNEIIYISMPKRANLTTQDYLVTAPLPEATDTYTVIPHKDVIDKTKEILNLKGLIIEREFYKCNQGAQVAQGVYHLKYGQDPDIGLLFAWNNSYDKSLKFKCSVGGYVHRSLASMIGENMGSYTRKHTGTADNEAYQTIFNQISNADVYFKQLIAEKNLMKSVILTKEQRSALMGKLYFDEELLTGEQLGIVRSQFKRPSYNYDADNMSLWTIYNGIMFSLIKAHPRDWMLQQSMIHFTICKAFNITCLPEDNAVVSQTEISNLTVEELVENLNELELPNTSIDDFAPSTETEVEPVLVAEEEDLTWPCLNCNEVQDANAVFYDGQLCEKCANTKL